MLIKVLLVALSLAAACSQELISLSGQGADTTVGYRECRRGWQKFQGSCVKRLNGTYTYNQAQSECTHQDQERVSRLYSIKSVSSQPIYSNVIQLLQGAGTTTWSGLTTTPDNQLINAFGTPFLSPIPSGPTYADQHCTTVDSTSGLQYSLCSFYLPVICEANIAVNLCSDVSTKDCQRSHGRHAECQQFENYAFCACKLGFTMNNSSLCVSETAAKFTSNQVTCTEEATGRELLVFTNNMHANRRVPYSVASHVCSEYGASLPHGAQLVSSCITDFRFNLEQSSDEATLVSSPMDVPDIWIQDTRGKCKVADTQGMAATRDCGYPSKFLCVKPVTSTYWCEAADQLLVRITPTSLDDARSKCSSLNFWHLPVSSSLLSTSSFASYPELKSCVAAAASIVQIGTTPEYPNRKVSMEDGQNCVTYDVQADNLTSTCDFSSSNTFCVRDAPRTVVNLQTKTEYFHPMGNVRYAKAAYSTADSLCKLAGGGIVKDITKSNASIIERAVMQLIDYVPNSNFTLPDDTRFLWSTSKTSGCTKVAISGELKSENAICSDRTVSYVCSKALNTRRNVTCPSYIYFHPDQDLLNVRHTYAVAASACQKAGGVLPPTSILMDMNEAMCLQKAASATHGLQHPVYFAKPPRKSIDLWMESSRAVNQTVFRSVNQQGYKVPRNSAQRYLCAIVTATSTTGGGTGGGGSTAGGGTSSSCGSCDAGMECLAGSTQCTPVDECESRPCDVFSKCSSMGGSYTCTCLSGYQNDTDSVTSPKCSNVNECQSQGCSGVNEVCRDTFGSFECLCKPGFTRSGGTCNDIDECRSQPSACPGPHSVCANTAGNFSCGCSKGYETNSTGSCVDVNECTSSPCGRNAICSNEDGGFECRCKAGFTWSKAECVNVNECLHVVCSSNANCTDTPGSFRCQCNAGYTGDGNSCENINECNVTSTTMPTLMLSQPCNDSLLCVDLEGSFACPCTANYTGDILCPAKKRTVDLVVEANRSPSTFSNPLILTGIAAGGVVVILLLVAVIRAARGKRPEAQDNGAGLPTKVLHGADTTSMQV